MSDVMGVAFDVDGTLYGYDGQPNEWMVNLAKILYSGGAGIHIWSGGGEFRARQAAEALLPLHHDTYGAKPRRGTDHYIDLAIDDVDTVDFGIPALVVSPATHRLNK